MKRLGRVAQATTPSPTAPATVRCAVYTRKSTEEGLDQEFNSLDAQRDSGESCIRSHAGEGWVCLPDRYDDGGFTGGNMERPALQRLLADIEAGKVDMVVVYKVDRLSRSLIDFAKIMQTFEKHQVSFVSVTQHFNTANSIGRLMLHVLLSFAQFEREIISERTRDKIAATRRKGKWSGGHPILGYDVDPNRFRLLVNEPEAERVRAIFVMYLEHESLLPAVIELDKRDWLNKRWTTRKGRDRGGKPFTRTSLYKLLTNVAYIGKVRRTRIMQPHNDAAAQPIDDFTMRIIRRKARQLVGRAGFTRSDVEDIEQELVMKVLKNRAAFDPLQACWHAFVATIVERHTATLLRDKRMEKRDFTRATSLDVLRFCRDCGG